MGDGPTRVVQVSAFKAIRGVRDTGHAGMRWDTLPAMPAAVALYESPGFVEIAPYRYNPIDGAKYWELDLNTWRDPDAPREQHHVES